MRVLGTSWDGTEVEWWVGRIDRRLGLFPDRGDVLEVRVADASFREMIEPGETLIRRIEFVPGRTIGPAFAFQAKNGIDAKFRATVEVRRLGDGRWRAVAVTFVRGILVD